MRIETSEQAEQRLMKVLLILLPILTKENIAIIAYPQEGGDFNFTVGLNLNKKKVKMEMSMTPMAQLSIESEPGVFATLDESGDMTEFWKQLFKQYYQSTLKK
jgi:hypothetical protein